MLGSYEYFIKAVYDITKIDLRMYKERQMKRRIDSMIVNQRYTSYSEYLTQLESDRTVFEKFCNYITINVSEFFRNPNQWTVLEKELLPEIIQRSGRNLKIWSAACSTGDEPYSLVMLLSKFLPLRNIRILATDIDKCVLEKAAVGLYHVKSLKGLPSEFMNKYFTQVSDSTYQIAEEIKACVDFRKHDLLKDTYPMDCDMIVCRNVLIYFTDEAKEKIYGGFHKSLKKGGILFVGSTEQIIQAQQLGFDNYRSFFYSKF